MVRVWVNGPWSVRTGRARVRDAREKVGIGPPAVARRAVSQQRRRRRRASPVARASWARPTVGRTTGRCEARAGLLACVSGIGRRAAARRRGRERARASRTSRTCRTRWGPALTQSTRSVASATMPWVAMNASIARRSPSAQASPPAHSWSRSIARAARRGHAVRRDAGQELVDPRAPGEGRVVARARAGSWGRRRGDPRSGSSRRSCRDSSRRARTPRRPGARSTTAKRPAPSRHEDDVRDHDVLATAGCRPPRRCRARARAPRAGRRRPVAPRQPARRRARRARRRRPPRRSFPSRRRRSRARPRSRKGSPRLLARGRRPCRGRAGRRPRSRTRARRARARRPSRSRVEGEARAADERRVLERQRDVVERVEEHHALVRRHPVRERIGLQRERLGRELAPARLGDSAVDVPEAKAAVVHDADARDPPGDVALELPPELAFFGQHALRGASGRGPRRWPRGSPAGTRARARRSPRCEVPHRPRRAGRWAADVPACTARSPRAPPARARSAPAASSPCGRALEPTAAPRRSRTPRSHEPPSRSSNTVRTTVATIRVGSSTRRKWLLGRPAASYTTAIGTSTTGRPAASARSTTSPSNAKPAGAGGKRERLDDRIAPKPALRVAKRTPREERKEVVGHAVAEAIAGRRAVAHEVAHAEHERAGVVAPVEHGARRAPRVLAVRVDGDGHPAAPAYRPRASPRGSPRPCRGCARAGRRSAPWLRATSAGGVDRAVVHDDDGQAERRAQVVDDGADRRRPRPGRVRSRRRDPRLHLYTAGDRP